MIRLKQVDRGDVIAWENWIGVAHIVAGGADQVREYVRTLNPRWRVFGSPDQPDRIFIAADKDVAQKTLRQLSINGVMLLPNGSAWEEIGIDGIDLFTSDSGDLALVQT